MMDATRSSEKSVVTRATRTRRHTTEDDILRSHRRETSSLTRVFVWVSLKTSPYSNWSGTCTSYLKCKFPRYGQTFSFHNVQTDSGNHPSQHRMHVRQRQSDHQREADPIPTVAYGDHEFVMYGRTQGRSASGKNGSIKIQWTQREFNTRHFDI
jgi:hypothetical protein